jgi:hypothetical protein
VVRWFGLAVIWGFFVGLVLGFMSGTAIGPVIVTLPGAVHGVHLGDLVGIAACTLLAIRTTAAVRREWAAR